MNNQDNHPMDPADLHQKAEEVAMEGFAGKPEVSADLSPEEMRKTIHELRLQQIELERQNEELRTGQTQVKAEEALREQRDFSESLIESAQAIILVLDTQGRIVRFNPYMEQLAGYPLDEVKGMDWFETFLTPEIDRTIKPLFHKTVADVHTSDNVNPIIAKDGRTILVEWSNKTLKDKGGGIVGILAIGQDITERKQKEIYREMGREILQILNQPGDLQESIQRVISTLKTWTTVDAVGLRLQEGEDFPYFTEDGFPADFLQTENTLLERSNDGGVCRDKDGNVCLECTCGLVISGKTDASNPLFTKGGSCWTNDSLPLLDLPSDQHPRMQPRNNCIHKGYASFALIPIRTTDRIVGLIQLNDKRKDRFTLDTIEMLEDIAAHIGSALMRRRAEEELQQSEERFKQLFELAPLGYQSLDCDGRFIEVNQAWLDTLGYTREEVIGKWFGDFLAPEYVQVFKERFPVFKAEGKIRSEFYMPHKNGSKRYITFDGRIGHKADGSFNQTHCILKDDTEHKRMEKQLKESEKSFKSLMQQSPFVVELYDHNGLQISVNKAYEELWNFPAETTLNKFNVLESKEVEETGLLDYVKRAYAGDSVDVPEYLFDPSGDTEAKGAGRKRWLNTRIYPLKDESGKVKSIVIVHQDVTERKWAEEALRESEERFKALHNASFGGIAIHDQGVILDCNQGLSDVSGFKYDELIGMDALLQLIAEQSRETVMAHIRSGYEKPYEVFGLRKNGQEYPLRLEARNIPYNGKRVRVVEFRDITVRKQAEIALQQKNQEMEQLVYIVSHDLKSPLVTVKTFAGMLRQDLLNADQPQINDDLNYIDKAANKMHQLLDALLHYSRVGRIDAPAQTVSVDQLVQNCLTTLAGILQQHQVQVSTSELPQQLQGDRLHLGQIWQNLIENAVKYRGNQPHPHIEVGATQEGLEVVFYVQDNGMGIAPEHRERIFNLFSQLNPGSDGSGLGLALVKKIVSIYQGRIWVESAGEGKGSCFMFTLPGALKKKDMAI